MQNFYLTTPILLTACSNQQDQNKFTYPFYEVVFMGKKADELQDEFAKTYHPNTIIAGATKENQGDLLLLKGRWTNNNTNIYVCEDKVCKKPVTTVNDMLQLIKQ